jgi:ferritin-like metal-binding protein YciE
METVENSDDARKTIMANDSSLYEFFKLQLQDIYRAEKKSAKALDRMQKIATNEDLSNELQDHIAETEKHISRLEEIFGIMGIKPQVKKCLTMDALIEETEAVIEETAEESSTRDAALIMAVQKIEHYEIAMYGSLIQFATYMGFEKIATLLGQTLQEEKDTDILLSDIADKKINWLAETEEKA